jgi:hypothetical protein
VAIALIEGTVLVARYAWRRQIGRYLVGLMGRREAVASGIKAIDSVVLQLSQSDVETLLAFAGEDSPERQAIAEIAGRMRIEASELADLALPKVLWPLADALGTSATQLAEQLTGVGESEGEAVLDALAALDLGEVRSTLATADAEIARVAEQYDVTDAAVYGGGLYI